MHSEDAGHASPCGARVSVPTRPQSQAEAGVTWAVIGAWPSGLTALKNLRQAGIDAECLEREDDIGGNWYYGSGASSVFASTRLISSK